MKLDMLGREIKVGDVLAWASYTPDAFHHFGNPMLELLDVTDVASFAVRVHARKEDEPRVFESTETRCVIVQRAGEQWK